jgi:hypothetical protein
VTTTHRKPISPATVTEWRRRREASTEPPQLRDNEEPPNEFRLPTYVATLPASGTPPDAFAESQRAGLTAIISLSKPSVPPPSPPADVSRPSPSGRQPLASPSVADAPFAGPTPAVALPTQIADPPRLRTRPVPATLERLPASGEYSSQQRRAVWDIRGLRGVSRLPLLVILTVQACLSLRLPWSNSAYTDEALYLWAGRLDWANLIHGISSPAFPTYFSGAPVLYPPLGAFAYSIGGLAGARILSLSFMLGATCLLWATTSLLYGRLAAFFAAGIWAVIGPTQFLGAFATYDAMALFLMALATCFAVRAVSSERWACWVTISALALVLANATKYATAIFDPVVIGVTYLAYRPGRSTKLARARAVAILTYTTALLIALIKIGGVWYLIGIKQTTLMRAAGNDPAITVLTESAHWVGLLAAVAAGGALICLASLRPRSFDILPLFLAAAIVLVPVEQARIHTIVSLDKHVDFGAWFAAIAAGYAVARILRLLRPRLAYAVACSACAGLLLVPAAVGAAQARAFFSWPNSSRFVATVRPLILNTPGHLLTDDTAILKFYTNVPWQRWSTTSSITLPSRHTISVSVGTLGDPAIYARYLRGGYFSLVILNLSNPHPDPLDQRISAVLKHDSHYALIAVALYGNADYEVWRYRTQRQPGRANQAIGR